MAVMHDLDWLFSIGIIFFLLSVWGIGANDVANSYATSVSSKSLTLVQAGCLAVITEFVGAIALGQEVTSTIRSGVFSISPFENSPGILIMAMVVAEVGTSAPDAHTISTLTWYLQDPLYGSLHAPDSVSRLAQLNPSSVLLSVSASPWTSK